MRKKYQVFISSTYEDLRQERQVVTWALLKARYVPVGMEAFSATDDRGWKTISATIDDSDYYILILAGKLGSLDKETGKSWTRREYEYARSRIRRTPRRRPFPPLHTPFFQLRAISSAPSSRNAGTSWHMRSTNLLKRFNEEIRRRTYVVRVFPNEESALRLIRALAAEQHEEWQEGSRYLSMQILWEQKREALRTAA